MPKIFSIYDMLDTTGATATGTALSYGRTDKSSVQVDLDNKAAGTTTIVVEGTTSATSTGTYVALNTETFTTTGASKKSYAVAITAPFTFVRVRCSAIATTSSIASAGIMTQGEGC